MFSQIFPVTIFYMTFPPWLRFSFKKTKKGLTGWRFRTVTVSSGLVSGGIAKTRKKEKNGFAFFPQQKKQFKKRNSICI